MNTPLSVNMEYSFVGAAWVQLRIVFFLLEINANPLIPLTPSKAERNELGGLVETLLSIWMER